MKVHENNFVTIFLERNCCPHQELNLGFLLTVQEDLPNSRIFPPKISIEVSIEVSLQLAINAVSALI